MCRECCPNLILYVPLEKIICEHLSKILIKIHSILPGIYRIAKALCL